MKSNIFFKIPEKNFSFFYAENNVYKKDVLEI